MSSSQLSVDSRAPRADEGSGAAARADSLSHAKGSSPSPAPAASASAQGQVLVAPSSDSLASPPSTASVPAGSDAPAAAAKASANEDENEEITEEDEIERLHARIEQLTELLDRQQAHALAQADELERLENQIDELEDNTDVLNGHLDNANDVFSSLSYEVARVNALLAPNDRIHWPRNADQTDFQYFLEELDAKIAASATAAAEADPSEELPPPEVTDKDTLTRARIAELSARARTHAVQLASARSSLAAERRRHRATRDAWASEEHRYQTLVAKIAASLDAEEAARAALQREFLALQTSVAGGPVAAAGAAAAAAAIASPAPVIIAAAPAAAAGGLTVIPPATADGGQLYSRVAAFELERVLFDPSKPSHASLSAAAASGAGVGIAGGATETIDEEEEGQQEGDSPSAPASSTPAAAAGTAPVVLLRKTSSHNSRVRSSSNSSSSGGGGAGRGRSGTALGAGVSTARVPAQRCVLYATPICAILKWGALPCSSSSATPAVAAVAAAAADGLPPAGSSEEFVAFPFAAPIVRAHAGAAALAALDAAAGPSAGALRSLIAPEDGERLVALAVTADAPSSSAGDATANAGAGASAVAAAASGLGPEAGLARPGSGLPTPFSMALAAVLSASTPTSAAAAAANAADVVATRLLLFLAASPAEASAVAEAAGRAAAMSTDMAAADAAAAAEAAAAPAADAADNDNDADENENDNENENDALHSSSAALTLSRSNTASRNATSYTAVSRAAAAPASASAAADYSSSALLDGGSDSDDDDGAEGYRDVVVAAGAGEGDCGQTGDGAAPNVVDRLNRRELASAAAAAAASIRASRTSMVGGVPLPGHQQQQLQQQYNQNMHRMSLRSAFDPLAASAGWGGSGARGPIRMPPALEEDGYRPRGASTMHSTVTAGAGASVGAGNGNGGRSTAATSICLDNDGEGEDAFDPDVRVPVEGSLLSAAHQAMSAQSPSSVTGPLASGAGRRYSSVVPPNPHAPVAGYGANVYGGGAVGAAGHRSSMTASPHLSPPSVNRSSARSMGLGGGAAGISAGPPMTVDDDGQPMSVSPALVAMARASAAQQPPSLSPGLPPAGPSSYAAPQQQQYQWGVGLSGSISTNSAAGAGVHPSASPEHSTRRTTPTLHTSAHVAAHQHAFAAPLRGTLVKFTKGGRASHSKRFCLNPNGLIQWGDSDTRYKYQELVRSVIRGPDSAFDEKRLRDVDATLVFTVGTTGKQLHLLAPDDDTLNTWIEALEHCINESIVTRAAPVRGASGHMKRSSMLLADAQRSSFKSLT